VKKLLMSVAVLAVLYSPAMAQSWGRGGAYAGANPGQGYYPRSSGAHWCTWSAATICRHWRNHGGRFNARVCPPDNMAMACQHQRMVEQRRSAKLR
jgi:hypothetical protein